MGAPVSRRVEFARSPHRSTSRPPTLTASVPRCTAPTLNVSMPLVFRLQIAEGSVRFAVGADRWFSDAAGIQAFNDQFERGTLQAIHC